jgi:hypothetical protein
MRGREFIMKDMYSFDKDEEASKKTYALGPPPSFLDPRGVSCSAQLARTRVCRCCRLSARRRAIIRDTRSYAEVVAAYRAILTRLGVHFAMVDADMGNIGGTSSHEFHALAVRRRCAQPAHVTCCLRCAYGGNATWWAVCHVPCRMARATCHVVRSSHALPRSCVPPYPDGRRLRCP